MTTLNDLAQKRQVILFSILDFRFLVVLKNCLDVPSCSPKRVAPTTVGAASEAVGSLRTNSES
jgi:hypothetical protein